MSPAQSPLPERLIDGESREALADMFAGLPRKLTIEVHASETPVPEDADSPAYNEALFSLFTLKITSELAELSPALSMRRVEPGSPESAAAGVTMYPTIIFRVESGKEDVRFIGAPLGEEAKALTHAILMLGAGVSGFSEKSRKEVAGLDSSRNLMVFSSPGCPYCPGQVARAIGAAVENPEKIRVACVTADEFPEFAKQYGVGAVPHTVFSDTFSLVGQLPESAFVHALVHLETPPELRSEAAPQGAASDGHSRQRPGRRKLPPSGPADYDLIILGAGPAGLSAAIYAGRYGLSTLVLESVVSGGQVRVTPQVENYPGFESISGAELTDRMAKQAKRYAELREGVEVLSVQSAEDAVVVESSLGTLRSKALLFACGAQRRLLNVPGEAEFQGQGVVFCATCDGYLYKGKKAVVVGGGNTALTDALHLHGMGVDVTIMHRRDEFRGEKELANAVEAKGIPVLWNHIPLKIEGEGKVNALLAQDKESGKETRLETDAVFVAVGHVPNSSPAYKAGVALLPDRTIDADADGRTSVDRLYAAGDVCGGSAQIVTAASDGTKAAMAVFEDLHYSG